jgi:trypsin-like peptidase
MSQVPWVRVFCYGANRGGGVLLTSELAVTAAHCVKDVAVGHEPGVVMASVGHGVPIPAEVVEKAERADLALVRLSAPVASATRLPWASPCYRGDGWFAPSRPTQSDPELVGSVSNTLIYECFAGGQIQAIQLLTQPNLGLYEGYSGGPVLLTPEDSNRVAGVLIEQHPDRLDGTRATNVLFAATIDGAFDQFRTLSTNYLLRYLMSTSPVPPPGDTDTNTRKQVPATQEAAEAPRSRARTTHEWLGEVDVFDPEIRSVHQALVSKWIIEHGEKP